MPEMYNMDLEKGVTFCLLSIKTLILVLYNFSIAFSIPICMLSMQEILYEAFLASKAL